MLRLVQQALEQIRSEPGNLAKCLRHACDLRAGDPDAFSVDALLAHVEKAGLDDLNDPIRLELHRALQHWDYIRATSWAADTVPNTTARRKAIYKLLALTEDQKVGLDRHFPFATADRPTVIAIDHEPWYFPETSPNNFYWKSYCGHLKGKGWIQKSMDALDESTRSVVERLSNPSREEAYQSKGLVVGYVQSGKTANFTGVISRAADAGYRLVILLTGMTELLRRQTQRRLDSELAGLEFLEDDEYADDAARSSFVSYGGLPSLRGHFDWQRLTGPSYDYQSLKKGIDALEFTRINNQKPFYESENLAREKCRLIVMKKNPLVMRKVIKDLRKIQTRLADIPTLIIDDESDQASINTKKSGVARAPVNEAIVSLLGILPRAQYVGYTATPFANVFVDPTQPVDIFPKDFLLSLPRPPGYMGARDFFDLDDTSSERGVSNRAAFVRDLVGEDMDEKGDNLQRALDSFVLTGAIKLYRESLGIAVDCRHHTMLMHLGPLKAGHAEQTVMVGELFNATNYRTGEAYERLRNLYKKDFADVSQARAPEMPVPSNFDEIGRHLGEVLRRASSPKPVLKVNSDEDADAPDFDTEPVWKIIVGGSKLSRGYTVEGLTVSYFRRGASTDDTLMQMGRWFGFRRGYGDIVRLFIGIDEKRAKKTINLYEAFQGVCRSEEDFREELKRYVSMDQRIKPIDVPPLVAQYCLPPTAKNKMFNANIVFKNLGRTWVEPTMTPTSATAQSENWVQFEKLASAVALTRSAVSLSVGASTFSYSVLWGRASKEAVASFLSSYKWLPRARHPIQHAIEFSAGSGTKNPGIDDWLILMPQRADSAATETRSLNGSQVSWFERGRISEDGPVGVYTEPRHKLLAEFSVIGERADQTKLPLENVSLDSGMRRVRTATLLVYPTVCKGETELHPGFAMFFPPNGIKDVIRFTVANLARPNAPTVDAD